MATKAKRRPKPKLTASQRQRRADDRNILLQPATTLAGTPLRRAADALTRAEYRPKLTALDRQARNAKAQGTALVSRSDDYYRQLASGEADRVARQKALSQDLDQRLSRIGAESGAQIDRAQAEQRTAADEDRTLRGGAGGGDTRVTDELAAQRARSATSSQAARTAGAGESANYEGLVNAMGGSRATHGAEVRRELTNRLANQLAELRGRKTELNAAKADTTLKNLLTLRQTGFENAATLRGLGIKEEDINARAATAKAQTGLASRRQSEVERNNRRQARLARQRNATTRRGQDIGHQDRVRGQDVTKRGQDISHQDRAAKGKGKRGKEPQSSINTRAQVTAVQGRYEQLLRHFNGDHAKTAQKIRAEARRNKQSLPEYVLIAAADLANFGYVTPGHVRALRNAGVRVPRGWRRRPGAANRAAQVVGGLNLRF